MRTIIRTYNGLMDTGNKSTKGSSHIDGIEKFWAIVKTRLYKYRGFHKSTLCFHLKECGFRFNYQNENLYH